MRRRYVRELYADRVSRIKTLIPHAAIGADVIVGFPGETEDDFKETFNFLHSLEISYLHVFTYSERENTRAFEMNPFVPVSVRNERNKIFVIFPSKNTILYLTSCRTNHAKFYSNAAGIKP